MINIKDIEQLIEHTIIYNIITFKNKKHIKYSSRDSNLNIKSHARALLNKIKYIYCIIFALNCLLHELQCLKEPPSLDNICVFLEEQKIQTGEKFVK